MTRILSILVAVSAALYVFAAPIPNDNTFDIRDLTEEELIATREYIDSLPELERRKFNWKSVGRKLGGVAKFAGGIAGTVNPGIGIAAGLASKFGGKRGRQIGGFFGARDVEDDLDLRDFDDEEELNLRDVDDELALRDSEEELDIRDLSDEDVALATRDWIDSLSEVERRNFFRKAVAKAKGLARGAASFASKANPYLGAAANVAGALGGKRGRQLSRGLNAAYGASNYFRRNEDDADVLALRDVEDELDMRDLSDEDLALAVRAVWEDMDENERRGWFDSVKSATGRAFDTVRGVTSQAQQYVPGARHLLGAAASLASKNPRTRGIATGIRTANRAIGRSSRAASRLGLRDVEDDE